VLTQRRVILNADSQHYARIKGAVKGMYEDIYCSLDSVAMASNCIDFRDRVLLASYQALRISSLLYLHPRVHRVYYPFFNDSRRQYERCKKEISKEKSAGWGYLLSVEFFQESDAVKFYDNLDIAKGPNHGTNFTLASPYTLLAHYRELDLVRT
jgi:cystathionine gamma-synthase